MDNLILTPLGAGNYQYVVRITASTYNKPQDNQRNNIIYSNGDNFIQNIDESTHNTRIVDNSGEIPSFCVLKILKHENVNDYTSRIQFHYQFNNFFNHFIRDPIHAGTISAENDRNTVKNIMINTSNNIANNVPNKRLCIIDKSVSQRLRNIFNHLLMPSSNSTKNYMKTVELNNKNINRDDGSNSNNLCNNTSGLGELKNKKGINKNKVMIFYDQLLERNCSIVVDPCSIKVLDSNELVDHSVQGGSNRILGSNIGSVDESRYELCSIEEDLFNINSFINTNTFGECKNNGKCNGLSESLKSDGEENGIVKEGGLLSNISVELKLKCGLKNFNNYPSIFEMNQINKKNVNYIIFNGHSVSGAKQQSYYDPTNFFKLSYKSVRKELINLIKVPQNNLRIFVNNYQKEEKRPFTNKVHAKWVNGKQGSLTDRVNGTHITNGDDAIDRLNGNDDELLEIIVKCILDNRSKLFLLLKLQSLAAGQQFVASTLYSIHNLFVRINIIASKYKALNTHPNIDNDSTRDIVLITKKLNIYDQFKSTEVNHYDIQRMFYERGIKLIYVMYIKLLSALNNMEQCKYYTTNVNTSTNRIFRRANVNRYVLFKLLNDIVACLLKSSSNGSSIIETGDDNEALDLLMLNDSVIKTVTKTIYNPKRSNISTDNNSMIYHDDISGNNVDGMPTDRELTRIKEWIYLYLSGRVSMDLSIIINILYISKNKSIDHNRILYNKLSFVDVDLKSIRNIYKWKYNVLHLINNFGK